MSLDHYINLLISLSSTSLNIWGFLLTVSLGIIAFLGSVQSFRLPFAVILCALFVGFAASNYLALENNFKQREEVINAIEHISDKNSRGEAFSQAKLDNQGIINSFQVSETVKKRSLRFQLAVSLLVSVLILVYPVYLTRKQKEFDADEAETRSDKTNSMSD